MTIYIGVPQAALLLLYAAGMICAVMEHGMERGPINAWTNLASIVLNLAILAWGGFFS